MTNRRRAAAATALVLATASVLTLAGCTSYGPPYACADWVQFDDPQDMYDEAELVVEAVVGGANGEVRYETGPGVLHGVTIERAHKGEALGGGSIAVSAPRDYCVENPPDPSDDPLVEGERVLLFLRLLDDSYQDPGSGMALEKWTVLTPWDGILPFPEGSELPFSAD